MANVITVSTAELKSKSGELRETNNSFMTQIENLKSEEEALNGMWDGDANDAFHTEFSRDITQLTNFYNAIANYATALEQIASQYDNVEAANQNIAATRTY